MKRKTIKKRIHKIGKHGAIGWETRQGWRICAECKKRIHEKKK